ncbi:hypothetical protein QJQ45_027416, partial [Haematococcus lacustris]
ASCSFPQLSPEGLLPWYALHTVLAVGSDTVARAARSRAVSAPEPGTTAPHASQTSATHGASHFSAEGSTAAGDVEGVASPDPAGAALGGSVLGAQQQGVGGCEGVEVTPGLWRDLSTAGMLVVSQVATWVNWTKLTTALRPQGPKLAAPPVDHRSPARRLLLHLGPALRILAGRTSSRTQFMEWSHFDAAMCEFACRMRAQDWSDLALAGLLSVTTSVGCGAADVHAGAARAAPWLKPHTTYVAFTSLVHHLVPGAADEGHGELPSCVNGDRDDHSAERLRAQQEQLLHAQQLQAHWHGLSEHHPSRPRLVSNPRPLVPSPTTSVDATTCQSNPDTVSPSPSQQCLHAQHEQYLRTKQRIAIAAYTPYIKAPCTARIEPNTSKTMPHSRYPQRPTDMNAAEIVSKADPGAYPQLVDVLTRGLGRSLHQPGAREWDAALSRIEAQINRSFYEHRRAAKAGSNLKQAAEEKPRANMLLPPVTRTGPATKAHRPSATLEQQLEAGDSEASDAETDTLLGTRVVAGDVDLQYKQLLVERVRAQRLRAVAAVRTARNMPPLLPGRAHNQQPNRAGQQVRTSASAISADS